MDISGFSFEQCLQYARFAEHAERFEDMTRAIKRMTELDPSTVFLDSDCRNLLSVAYKNVVGSLRTAWRTFCHIEERKEDYSDSQIEILKNYKDVIRNELNGHCNEVIGIIDGKLLTVGTESDPRVFFLKMKGDYYRYMAEIAEDKKDVSDKANAAYDGAYSIAKEHLDALHPVLLGLALNYSVFHYEIEGDVTKAIELAKQAHENAVQGTDGDPDTDNYRDSALILQLLRDNLTLWSSDDKEDD